MEVVLATSNSGMRCVFCDTSSTVLKYYIYARSRYQRHVYSIVIIAIIIILVYYFYFQSGRFRVFYVRFFVIFCV